MSEQEFTALFGPSAPAGSRRGSGGPAPRAGRGAQPAKAKPRKPAAAKARKPAAAKKPAAKRVKLVAPAAGTRGPWVVAVDYLGRPPTLNAERASARSMVTMLRTREAKAAWEEAFVREVTAAGIPALGRCFITFQPFYPGDVVPDPDALPPATKAAIDALVSAGVIPNDRRQELAFGFHTLPAFSDGGPPRLVMTVHPLS